MKTIKCVIDTNVLFAGLYSADGASFQLLRLIEFRRLIPVLSATLWFEYEDILDRKRDVLGLSSKAIKDVLDGLCRLGEGHAIHFLWRPQLPDPKDDHILELAIAAGGMPIVTHNTRDFGPAQLFGIRVVKPAELLKEFK